MRLLTSLIVLSTFASVAQAWNPHGSATLSHRECSAPAIPPQNGWANGVVFKHENAIYFVTSYANVREGAPGTYCHDLTIHAPRHADQKVTASLVWSSWDSDLALLKADQPVDATEQVWTLEETFYTPTLLKQVNAHAAEIARKNHWDFTQLDWMDALYRRLNDNASCSSRQSLPGLSCAIEGKRYEELVPSQVGAPEYEDFTESSAQRHERLAGIRSREILWITERWSTRTASALERDISKAPAALQLWIPQHLILEKIEAYFAGKPEAPRFRMDGATIDSGNPKIAGVKTTETSYQIFCPVAEALAPRGGDPIGGIDLGGIGGIDLGGIGGIDLGGIGGASQGSPRPSSGCLVKSDRGTLAFLAERDAVTGMLRASGIASLDQLIHSLDQGARAIIPLREASAQVRSLDARLTEVARYVKDPLARALLTQIWITTQVAGSSARELLKASDFALLLEGNTREWSAIEQVEQLLPGDGTVRELLGALKGELR